MSQDAPPHVNLGLERQVLGQMLAYRGTFDAYVAEGLERTDFYRAVHIKIYDAIAAVEALGVAADLVTTGLELRHRGAIADVGEAYFSGLVDAVVRPSEGAITTVVRELTTIAAKRSLAKIFDTASLSDLSAELDSAIVRHSEGRRMFDAAAQLQTIRDDIQRDRAGRVWLGFPTLDRILEGLRPGEVFGLMARPGIGKTLALGHVARAQADFDLAHVFFSLEMPAAQIVERIARAHYGLHRDPLRDRLDAGVLDADDYIRTFAGFVLVDAPGLDVARMAAKLRQLQAGVLKGRPIRPIRLVTVDHLGLIGGDRKMSTYDRVSTQARELKELAKRFECTVLLAVQVNREAGGDGSKELGLGAARDSGVVEEAMDYLVAIRRLDRSQSLGQAERDKYRDVLFAKVVKNRHGAPDTEVAIRFDARTLRLEEDATVEIEADDLSRIAASAGRRR